MIRRDFHFRLFILAAITTSCLIVNSCGAPSSSGGVLLQIDGVSRKDEGLGRQVQKFADVDDDGRDDIIASSPYGLRGHFGVYSGATGELLYRIESVRDEYLLKNFRVMRDHDGDGIPEIASHDTWTSRGLCLFSGKDGSLIFKTREKINLGSYFVPHVISVPDKDGDGTDDLAACWGETGLVTVSGKDGTMLDEVSLPKEPLEYVYYRVVADMDDDGYDDIMGYGDKTMKLGPKKYKRERRFWFISSRDFGTIRESFEPQINQTPEAFECADVNDDGIPDMICSVLSGGEPAGSVLVAISGEDGSELWRVNGADIEAGAKMTTIDAKTGEEIMQYTDAGFDDPMALLPDMNGDAVPEVATGHPSLFQKETGMQGRIYIFSGKDGTMLKTLFPPTPDWRIGDSIAPYIDWNFDGTPDILAGAREFRIKERKKVGSIFVMAM